MHIDDYRFGRIVIDGCGYTRDVVLLPDRVEAGWRRREGHVLHEEDLTTVIAAAPRVLVIGSGYAGRMRVPQALLEKLRRLGMDVHVHPTREAVGFYNRMAAAEASLAAALHLTC